MSIRCLFGRHNWKFAYNHNMPLGTSTEEASRMFRYGKTYPVDQCTRCPKQSRLLHGRRVMLSRSEMQTP